MNCRLSREPIANLFEPSIQTDYGHQLRLLPLVGRPKKVESIEINLASLIPVATDANPAEIEDSTTEEASALPEQLPSTQNIETLQLVGVVGQGLERKAMIYRSLSRDLLSVRLQEEIQDESNADDNLSLTVTEIKHDSIQVKQRDAERTIYIGEHR